MRCQRGEGAGSLRSPVALRSARGGDEIFCALRCWNVGSRDTKCYIHGPRPATPRAWYPTAFSPVASTGSKYRYSRQCGEANPHGRTNAVISQTNSVRLLLTKPPSFAIKGCHWLSTAASVSLPLQPPAAISSSHLLQACRSDLALGTLFVLLRDRGESRHRFRRIR